MKLGNLITPYDSQNPREVFFPGATFRNPGMIRLHNPWYGFAKKLTVFAAPKPNNEQDQRKNNNKTLDPRTAKCRYQPTVLVSTHGFQNQVLRNAQLLPQDFVQPQNKRKPQLRNGFRPSTAVICLRPFLRRPQKVRKAFQY